jgi:hypothetical protein
VAAGVRRVCGVAGDSLNPVIDSIRRAADIEWIRVRNEEVAAFAAEAQLTGRTSRLRCPVCDRARFGRPAQLRRDLSRRVAVSLYARSWLHRALRQRHAALHSGGRRHERWNRPHIAVAAIY